MSWLELSVDASADEAEPVSDALQKLGASAVTISPRAGDEILEPAPGAQPLAAHNRVTGLFDAVDDADGLLRGLAQILGDERAAGATVQTLADAHWESLWRQEAPARCFGNGLWVLPHGDPVPSGARAVVRLDPGLAFGTGSHPTTALCLEWLAARDLVARTVTDFGCGSGVLAVAAAVLGAGVVFAVDHDPQALEATRDNARSNAVADRVHVTPDPLASDVVVANILANTLAQLAPRFAQLTRAGGLLALSGILPQQVGDLVERYSPWFDLDPPRESEGWVLLSGSRAERELA
jgi:ribosomal protein L11 methyltransferase